MFDVDGSGTIDEIELMEVCRGMGEVLTNDEVGLIMKAADTDGDGMISLAEFSHLLCNAI